jgi:hypothetical protein
MGQVTSFMFTLNCTSTRAAVKPLGGLAWLRLKVMGSSAPTVHFDANTRELQQPAHTYLCRRSSPQTTAAKISALHSTNVRRRNCWEPLCSTLFLTI